MHRVRYWLLVAILITGFSAPAWGLDKQVLLQDIVHFGWSAYTDQFEGWQGGLASYVIHGQNEYFAQTGFDQPITADTHMRVASITKTFTSAAVMLLHEQGCLNIEDSITSAMPGSTEPYVPDTADYDLPYKDRITIRQVLEHRAGIFDVDNDPVPASSSQPYAGKDYVPYVEEELGLADHTFTFDELVGVAAADQLSYFEPGGGYHYSDTGYSLLGKIIERVSGQTYGQFVYDNFLAPLGMDSASLPSQGWDQSIPAPHAEGYTLYGGQIYDTTVRNVSPHVSEGNLIISPQDLAGWFSRLYRGEAGLSQETAAMIMEVIPTGSGGYYGLGCQYTPGLGYGHGGAIVGYLSLARFDPANDLTIVEIASGFNADDLAGQTNALAHIAYTTHDYLLGDQ